jgi:predicted O-methyltransferase YrrM
MNQEWMTWQAMQPFAANGTLLGEDDAPHAVNSASTPNNLTVLAHYHRVLQPERTLEIGLAFGASASLLLTLHELAGAGEHHAIDPYQRSHWKGVALRHLEEQRLDHRFTWHEALSSVALPKLVETGLTFGLIYVDGSHLFEDVMIDFFYASRLVTDGGIIAFDDSSCGHVAKVVSFIRRNLGGMFAEESPYLITAPRSPKLKAFAARVLRKQQLTLFRKVGEPVRDWNTPFVNF